MNNGTDPSLVINAKIAEIQSLIANHKVRAEPNWTLEEDFAAFFAPYYLNVLSFNGSVTFVLHLLVWYVLITKTPKEMKDYRLFLLNVSICSFFHDLQLSVLWRPVPLFPSTSGFVSGKFARLFGPHSGHIGFVLCIFLICTYITSMVLCFCYRMVALLERKWYNIMMSWYGLGFLVCCQFVPGITLCPLLIIADAPYEIIRNRTLNTYPQLEPIFESEYAFGYDVDYNPFLVYFFMLALFFILVILPIIESSCIAMIVYQLKKVKHSISEKTYKLHKNLVIALIIQIMLPNVMIILPDILIIIGVWQGWKYMSFFTEVGIIMCSIHSVLDNFVMLVAITPYRQAVGKMISQQKSTVMTITSRLTSHHRVETTA